MMLGNRTKIAGWPRENRKESPANSRHNLSIHFVRVLEVLKDLNLNFAALRALGIPEVTVVHLHLRLSWRFDLKWDLSQRGSATKSSVHVATCRCLNVVIAVLPVKCNPPRPHFRPLNVGMLVIF